MAQLIVTAKILNKHKYPVSDFSDKSGVVGMVMKGFAFEGVEVPGSSDPSAKWYKDRDGYYYWGGGVIDITLDASAISNTNKWWLDNYSIPELWNRGLTGKGVAIAVLDTGVSYPHPDLDLNDKFFHDVTGSPTGPIDIYGHGTHCIGIIKASNNETESIGIAYDSTIYSCKITNDEFGDDPGYLLKGLNWAIEKNVDIISISNGSPVNPGQGVEQAIKVAADNGILIICAAGNITPGFPDNRIYYPARFADTVSVGGIDENRLPISSTILSGETKLFAPGKEILSTYKNSGYSKKTGSSQATPFVAGVCALILENKRRDGKIFKASGLREALLSSATPFPFGRIINPVNLSNIKL